VLEDFPSPALARSLSPNGRVHWARRHEAKREAAHRVACEALLRRVVPVNGPVRITFRWIFPTAGRHDLDNLIATAKPLIDALVTAGLLEDDDSRHVVGIAAEVRLERGRRALEIEIVQALDPAPREDG
jgi:Holliday junction resolvase RusA-like endonuclease